MVYQVGYLTNLVYFTRCCVTFWLWPVLNSRGFVRPIIINFNLRGRSLTRQNDHDTHSREEISRTASSASTNHNSNSNTTTISSSIVGGQTEVLLTCIIHQPSGKWNDVIVNHESSEYKSHRVIYYLSACPPTFTIIFSSSSIHW